MEKTITLTLTQREYTLLCARYERSLELDSARQEYISDLEFALLQKMMGVAH